MNEQINQLPQQAPESPQQENSKLDIGPQVIRFSENKENKRNIFTIFHQCYNSFKGSNYVGSLSLEEIESMEDEIAQNLQEISAFTPEAFMSLIASLNKNTPPMFGLIFLAGAPIERIGLSKEQKRSLGLLSFHWLKELISQDISPHKHPGRSVFRHHFNDGQTQFKVGADHFVLLRALSRRGILNFENYGADEEIERLRPALTALVQSSLIGQTVQESATYENRSNSYPTLLSQLPIQTNIGRSQKDNESIRGLMLTPQYDGHEENGDSSPLTMLSIGWAIMREQDYRLNWQYTDAADAANIAATLAPVVVDCLFAGVPLSIKSTSADDSQYQGRFIIYTDTVSADQVLTRLVSSKLMPQPIISEKGKNIEMYPFGQETPIYIRTTHEVNFYTPKAVEEAVKKDFAYLQESLYERIGQRTVKKP